MSLSGKDKWVMSEHSDHLSFIHLDSMLIDNIPVMRQVTVKKDLSWSIKIHGLDVPSQVTSLVPTHLLLLTDLEVLLNSAAMSSMCEGCENPELVSANTSNKSVLQIITKWPSDVKLVVRRSTDCNGLISKVSKRKKCPDCCQLQKNLTNFTTSKSRPAPSAQEKDKKASEKEKISSSHVNWRFLSEEEKRMRHEHEQKRRRNAERREKYLKKKMENEKFLIQLTQSDSDDMKFMFNELDQGVDADENELTFDDSSTNDAFYWKMQRDINKSGKALWHPRFLEVCLRLWQRSKEGYQEFSESGFIKLPSGRYLRKIKNKVMQTPGIKKDHLDWMCKQALSEKTTEAGRNGYLMFDEMAIQGDLQLRKIGDTFELCGLVRMGDVQDKMRSFSTPDGKIEAEMATHILQFTFVGIEGFEFPVAYYPTAQVDPMTLYHLYWDIICVLQEREFYVHLGVCDGAQANRAFVLLHFEDEKEALESNFTTINPYSGGHHSFMMDSSNYKDHLEAETKAAVDKFDKTLEFLTITSTLLKNFKSKAPYRSLDDSRFIENNSCLQWFDEWKRWMENKKKNAEKSQRKNMSKMFISPKLQFDLSSMILGFRVY